MAILPQILWNFWNNRKRFIEGEDYFRITAKEFGTNFAPNSKMAGNPNSSYQDRLLHRLMLMARGL